MCLRDSQNLSFHNHGTSPDIPEAERRRSLVQCGFARENDFFRDMGVCVSMSGNGCRAFETMSKLTQAGQSLVQCGFDDPAFVVEEQPDLVPRFQAFPDLFGKTLLLFCLQAIRLVVLRLERTDRREDEHIIIRHL